MSSPNNISLPIDIGFTLESFVDTAKILCTSLHIVTINIDQAEAIINIMCPKVCKYYTDFGSEHVSKNDIYTYAPNNIIDKQVVSNIKKIHKQLKAIIKTKYHNSMYIRKIVPIYIHGICQGHCKYVQSHKYEEHALETNEDEIIRVACIIKNMKHYSTLQKCYLQYAVELLHPTKQIQSISPSDVPKIKTNAYMRKKVSEYSKNVVISSDVLQYWNYLIFEINK